MRWHFKLWRFFQKISLLLGSLLMTSSTYRLHADTYACLLFVLPRNLWALTHVGVTCGMPPVMRRLTKKAIVFSFAISSDWYNSDRRPTVHHRWWMAQGWGIAFKFSSQKLLFVPIIALHATARYIAFTHRQRPRVSLAPWQWLRRLSFQIHRSLLYLRNALVAPRHAPDVSFTVSHSHRHAQRALLCIRKWRVNY